MQYLPVTELKAGMICAMTLYNKKMNILLNANKILNNNIINRMKLLGLDGLCVYNETDNIKYNALISEDTRNKALKKLEHIDIDGCLYVANQITNEILQNKDLMLDMTNISLYDNNTYMHSINVAIISTMIGVDMRLNNYQLKQLSQAALLHDIGKTYIDKTILNKKAKLTDEEFKIITKHPYYGYIMFKDKDTISAVVKNAIYSHHENEDGSGYPRGLTGDKIHLFAKIIHVADVYDALISKRSYKENFNPADAFEYLLAHTNEMFDRKVVNALTNCIALYHVGTEVLLSNNEWAVVIENQKGLPTRPIVLTKSGAKINLVNQLNITILKCKPNQQII